MIFLLLGVQIVPGNDHHLTTDDKGRGQPGIISGRVDVSKADAAWHPVARCLLECPER
jgi:hypothetical protein